LPRRVQGLSHPFLVKFCNCRGFHPANFLHQIRISVEFC
jgi:hypothetical protein